MTIFNRVAGRAARLVVDPVVEAPVVDDVVIAPVGDPDPMADVPADDGFDEQRARREKENRVDGVTQEGAAQEATQEVKQEIAVVDGADDDLNIGAADSDKDTAEGEFGEDPEPKGDMDVVVDADISEATWTSEEEDGMESNLDSVYTEEMEIQSLFQEMGMLADGAMAIESFGFNPTVCMMMQKSGLLAGTALEAIGLESVSFSKGEDAESMMAIEALGEKIKEKSNAWAAKIVHLVSSSSEKIMSVLTPMWNSITGMIKKATSAAWDKTKAAGAVVKAHPYATVLAVIAAMAAVAGIVMFASGGPAMTANKEVISSYLKKLAGDISKIKFPGGAIKATVNEAGTKIAITFTKAAVALKEGSLTSLGWMQSSVKAMEGPLTRAFDALKGSWGKFAARTEKLVATGLDQGKKVVGAHAGAFRGAMDGAGAGAAEGAMHMGASYKSAEKAGLVGGFLAGAGYLLYLSLLVTVMFRLVRFVVVGGFRMIAATLRAIMPHSAPMAAAA